mgnify:CR=1 FL=1
MHSNDAKAAQQAVKNFVKAIGKGLRKVMSKMGISTYMSYTGAQIFEALGLSRALVDKYFTGTTSNVEGIGVFEVAEETLRVHRAAFGDDPVLANALDAGGEYAFRVRGEEHMWTPDAVAKLQQGVRNNSYATYKEYAQIINDQSRRHMTLRGLNAGGGDALNRVASDVNQAHVVAVEGFKIVAVNRRTFGREWMVDV